MRYCLLYFGLQMSNYPRNNTISLVSIMNKQIKLSRLQKITYQQKQLYLGTMEKNQTTEKPKPKRRMFEHRDQGNSKQTQAQLSYKLGKQAIERYNLTKNIQQAKLARQKFGEAITLLQSSGITDRGETMAKYHAERGAVHMETGEFQQALYDFGTAVRFDGKQPQYYAHRANCMMMLNQINDALLQFGMAIQLKPDGIYYFNRGLVHQRLMNYQKAIEDFTNGIKHIKSGETHFKALFHRGNCFRNIKQYQKSIDDLKKACDIVREDAPAHNNLGLSYFENKQYQEALQQFKKAIEIDPVKATYYSNKALALYHTQQHKQSLAQLNKALSFDPNDARTIFNRGNTYLSLREIQKAHADYDKAIELDPKNHKFYHSKGLAYQQSGDYDKAIQQFQKALNIAQKNVPSRYHLGLMLHKTGRLGEAIENLTTVLKQIGEERLVYQSRGLVYQDSNNHKAALQDFNNAANVEPNYPETYFHRGTSKIQLAKLGQSTFQSAVQDFMYAQQLGSKNPGGIFNGIGICYRHLKDYDKSLYYLNEGLRKQPSNYQFFIQRSNIYIETKEYTKAINDLNSALDNKPKDPQILYKLGLAYFKNKQFKKAIQSLYESLQNKPFQTYQADIYYNLGINYANLDLPEKAVDPFTKAIQLAPTEPSYLHQRAKVYLLTGKYEKSLNDYIEVIKYQPRNSHAYFGRAFAYKALKEYDKSAQDFDKAKELDPMNPHIIINPKKIYDIKYIKLCNPGEQQK